METVLDLSKRDFHICAFQFFGQEYLPLFKTLNSFSKIWKKTTENWKNDKHP